MNLVDKVAVAIAKRWIKKNLTASNIVKGAAGLCSWLAKPETREALWALTKGFVVGVVTEMRKDNEKTISD